MPDPTAHADDMKSLAVIEPNTSPAFWWVNPWGYALNLKRALHAVHLLSETTEDAYQAATNVIKQKQDLVDRQSKAIMDTANEAGFQESKTGYVINGQPISPFPLTWLGEAVVYWKSEAYAARRQRDEAKGLADYHRTNLNDFQRKVELTLKPACPYFYEDTIGYVQWAADEIKALKASLSVITEDRDAYIEKLEKANAGRTLLVSRDKQIDGLFADIEREKQKVEAITLMCNKRDGVIVHREEEIIRLTNLTRSLKRKLSKAEKAKPLWEDKTKTLTHGVSFTLGNHEDRHDPVREAYASLGRKFIKAGIKAQAKAKKKGGSK